MTSNRPVALRGAQLGLDRHRQSSKLLIVTTQLARFLRRCHNGPLTQPVTPFHDPLWCQAYRSRYLKIPARLGNSNAYHARTSHNLVRFTYALYLLIKL